MNAACILMPEDANNCHILANICTIFVRSVNTFLGNFSSLHPLLLTHGQTDSKPMSHVGDTLLRVMEYEIFHKPENKVLNPAQALRLSMLEI